MKRHLVAVLAVPALFTAASVFAVEVKMNGATTVVDRVIAPHKAAVEKATGNTLSIIGNATGRGLVDLMDGKCDAALVSEPMEIAADAAKAAGKEVDLKKLQMHVIAHDEIVFVTHKSNPVKSLTWQQIKDIHTGKISNWKDVGGKDMPITVFTDALTGGTRAMIKSIVLEGQEYGDASKPQPSVKKAGELVGATEGGFAGIGKGFAEADKVTIVQTKKLERPLAFVTVGAPSPKVAKVIVAFKSEAKK